MPPNQPPYPVLLAGSHSDEALFNVTEGDVPGGWTRIDTSPSRRGEALAQLYNPHALPARNASCAIKARSLVLVASAVWRALLEPGCAGMSGPSCTRLAGYPPSKVADTDLGEVVVLDMDPTLEPHTAKKEPLFFFQNLGVVYDELTPRVPPSGERGGTMGKIKFAVAAMAGVLVAGGTIAQAMPSTSPGGAADWRESRAALEAEAANGPQTLPSGDPYDHVAAVASEVASDVVIDGLRENPDFAGVSIVDDSVLVVQWRGADRRALDPVLAEVAARGFQARVVTAAYGEAEVLRAIKSLPRDPTVEGGGGLSGSPRPDGIKLWVDPKSDLLTIDFSEIQIILDLSIPIVAVEVMPKGVPLIENRSHDEGSLDGGARIWNSNGDGCTAGQRALRLSTGTNGMVTARHCLTSTSGSLFADSALTEYRGYGQISSVARDLAWFSGSGFSGFSGAVYSGGASTTSKDLIGDALWPTSSTINCITGASSGDQCGTVIIEPNITSGSYQGQGIPTPATYARRTGAGAAAHGDSGATYGKWVFDAAANRWRVRPIGFVSQGRLGTETNTCASGVTTPCFEGIFTGIARNIEVDWGLDFGP